MVDGTSAPPEPPDAGATAVGSTAALDAMPHGAVAVSARAAGPVGVTRLTLFWYCLGETATAAKTVLTGIFVLFFYTSVIGIPGAMVGLTIGIAFALDAIAEPWIGHLSDRARGTRFGGRHSFMLIGALTIGVCFLAQFTPPPGATLPVLLAWVLVTALAVRVANAFFLVPYYALGADMSQDYYDRTTVTALRAAFGLAATLLTASLSFVLFFPNDGTGADPKLRPEGYVAMGLVFGAAMTVVTLASTLGTFKLRHLGISEQQVGQPPQTGPMRTTGQMLVTALQPGPFSQLFWANAFTFVALAVNGVLGLAFLTYYAQITRSADLSALQASVQIAGLTSSLLWIRFGRRFEKGKSFFGATVLCASVLLGARMLIGPGHVFGTGNVWPLLVGESLAGLAVGLFTLLPYSMLADITDHDELKHGVRRQGAFVGVMRVGQQVGTGVTVLATGILVDWFAHIVPGQAVQSATTIERVGYGATLLPALLLVPAALLMWQYRLNRHQVADIQTQLDARREAYNSVAVG
jgi:Na+/melibiose symporter-like transporter